MALMDQAPVAELQKDIVTDEQYVLTRTVRDGWKPTRDLPSNSSLKTCKILDSPPSQKRPRSSWKDPTTAGSPMTASTGTEKKAPSPPCSIPTGRRGKSLMRTTWKRWKR